LPEVVPPILITQHMPGNFTQAFANRLNTVVSMRVKLAEQGERLANNTAYIAPGGVHLRLARDASGYYCQLTADAPVNGHRPSVDALFQSAAACIRLPACAVLLTGMGKDGAAGMLALRQRGVWTIAESRESCVVYGMPREAAQLGAACEVVPLDHIGAAIAKRLALVARVRGAVVKS
jgi:two-component system chemotaxis response regulator CheB